MQKFKLGQWVVDPTQSTIQCRQVIKLDHKVMQLLCFLVENRQAQITREQILDTVWAGQVVADDVLNVAISSLRKHLGDDSKNPTYIKTLPRKGYQIIAEVTQWKDSEPQWFSKKTTLAAISSLALLATIWIIMIYSQPQSKPEQVTTSTIAVLPFDYFASDNSRLYIADGLTESIINRLVQEKNLRVTSRTSVMRFRDNKQPIKIIGQQLSVDWILEGSVQLEDQQIQITAQLIEVATDKHIWSQSYHRNLTDLFAIQADISAEIARQFSHQPQSISQRDTRVSPLAYNHYLRARYYLNSFELDKAEENFNRAIQESKNYADATAGIAQSYFLRAYSGKENTRDYVNTAAKYAKKAYQLDPNSAFSNLNIALTYFYHERNYPKAYQAFENAFDLNHQDTMIQEWYVTFLLVTKKFAQAKTLINHMRKISPLVYNKTSLYLTLYYAQEFDAALNEIEHISPYMSGEYFASSASAWIYLAQGDIGKLECLAPHFLAQFDFDANSIDRFKRELRDGGIPGAINYLLAERPNKFSDYEKAELFAWSDEREKALEILTRLEKQNDLRVYKILIEPAFVNLHQTPKFNLLLERLKLNTD